MSIQNPYGLLNRSYEVGLAEVSIREQIGEVCPFLVFVFDGRVNLHTRIDMSRFRIEDLRLVSLCMPVMLSSQRLTRSASEDSGKSGLSRGLVPVETSGYPATDLMNMSCLSCSLLVTMGSEGQLRSISARPSSTSVPENSSDGNLDPGICHGLGAVNSDVARSLIIAH